MNKGSLFVVILGIFVGFGLGYYFHGATSPSTRKKISFRYVPRPIEGVPREVLRQHEKSAELSSIPREAMHAPAKQVNPPVVALKPQPQKSEKVAKKLESKIAKPNLVKHSSHPQVAFIIDDFGNSLDTAKPFIQSPVPLAISILPQLPYSKELASEAVKARKTFLLHLPMEANSDNKSLGPGALLTNMDDASLKQAVATDLSSVPGAQGINNHMGSKGSSDPRLSRIVALAAKSHHLFIVDSVTSSKSVLCDEARECGVPSERREVFLDNDASEEAIRHQMEELIKIAQKKGKAIAIGHPHASTLKVIQEMMPALKKAGIQVVPVTKLVG